MLCTQVGGKRNQLPKENKSKWPTLSQRQDKKVSKPNLDFRGVEDNSQQRVQVKSGCGDMVNKITSFFNRLILTTQDEKTN